jgi:Mg/Co/Ni transporter MgtE
MVFTMEDFNRQYIKEHFAQLTPEEQREALQALPPEQQQEVLQALPLERRLAGLSPEQIRQYLDQLVASRTAPPGKSRRKK